MQQIPPGQRGSLDPFGTGKQPNAVTSPRSSVRQTIQGAQLDPALPSAHKKSSVQTPHGPQSLSSRHSGSRQLPKLQTRPVQQLLSSIQRSCSSRQLSQIALASAWLKQPSHSQQRLLPTSQDIPISRQRFGSRVVVDVVVVVVVGQSQTPRLQVQPGPYSPSQIASLSTQLLAAPRLTSQTSHSPAVQSVSSQQARPNRQIGWPSRTQQPGVSPEQQIASLVPVQTCPPSMGRQVPLIQSSQVWQSPSRSQPQSGPFSQTPLQQMPSSPNSTVQSTPQEPQLNRSTAVFVQSSGPSPQQVVSGATQTDDVEQTPFTQTGAVQASTAPHNPSSSPQTPCRQTEHGP